MKFKFGKKFTEKHLDDFINKVYQNYKIHPSDSYYFDLTEVEYIANQELLVFSALLKSFKEKNTKFRVELFKKEVSTALIPIRAKKQLIQIWDVWQIWKITEVSDYYECFGIDGKSIERLKEDINYFPNLSEIYRRNGITPFIVLDKINNYTEADLRNAIRPVYKLNVVIENLLKTCNCYHPFISNALSTIITEELYANFLDHSGRSSFAGFKPAAFMSISIQNKFDEKENSKTEIQHIASRNFEAESISEMKSFFFDEEKKEFKNQPILQFSFLDFGTGIVETLRSSFLQNKTSNESLHNDPEILKFAFRHDTSRHPLLSYVDVDRKIPRGLFDVLSITKRYKGMLIVRSNHGKIIFNFAKETEIDKAHSYIDDTQHYFPGTLISIYLPAFEDFRRLDVSPIKPQYGIQKKTLKARYHISIFSMFDNLPNSKDQLYNRVLTQLKKTFLGNSPGLYYVSFKGTEQLDKRVIKKILFFLVSDYDINQRNSVIAINFENLWLLEEIDNELINLDHAIQNYKIHPLPIITFDKNRKQVDVFWLGVFNAKDKMRLKDLIFENYSISKNDLFDPLNSEGNTNTFDRYGNLTSSIPAQDQLAVIFENEEKEAGHLEVRRLFRKYDCLKQDLGTSIYLCTGNYYQKEYIQLSNLLRDKSDCNYISGLLFDEIRSVVKNIENYKFLALSSASQKILLSFREQNLIGDSDFIILSDTKSLNKGLILDAVTPGVKYILICDVLSTGYVTNALSQHLSKIGSSLEYVAVIVSLIDGGFEPSRLLLDSLGEKIISLMQYPIKKYLRKEIADELQLKNVIRINPYTDIPITISLDETKIDESVLFSNHIDFNADTNEIIIANDFLNLIDNTCLKIGYYVFNSLIHPFFFDTIKILKHIDESFLRVILNKLDRPELSIDNVKVFFPAKSGIESFSFEILEKALSNSAVEEISIDRISTPEGWRFPHNTDHLSTKIDDNICFILDDGSCTGDSLIQMIDEIAFYNAKEIILLCIIGRLNDHKREFFSRLSTIKVKSGKVIKVSIFFVTHWHIPTYFIEDNPTTKETTWLRELIRVPNVPRNIKRIATNILAEISPKREHAFTDFKYLPHYKGGKKTAVPKKEMLLIREELGKVMGYRVYKESFTFFDAFVKKYEVKRQTSNRYKEIELLCATLLYEPYLFDKIEDILPDVVVLLENFIKVLIFDDPKIFHSLTYDWNKRDIIHLFFIVFKDQKLIRELTTERLRLLMNFRQPEGSALSYVLYKLLHYIPLKPEQFETAIFDQEIKNKISKILNGVDGIPKEIYRFNNFLSSLPSRLDLQSQLSIIQNNYSKQNEPEYHDEKISFGHNVSLIVTTIRQCIGQLEDGKALEQGKLNEIKNAWFDILNFVNPILSFSSSFPDFLSPYPYYKLYKNVEENPRSLREVVGENEEILFSLATSYTDVEKLRLLVKNVIKIQVDFDVDSLFHQLIAEPETNLDHFVRKLEAELKSIGRKSVIKRVHFDKALKFNIPNLYSTVVIIKELITNLKNYSSKSQDDTIEVTSYSSHDNSFILSIANMIDKKNAHKSIGEGLKCLKLLTDAELFGFTYIARTVNNRYFQNLKFTVY